MFMGRAKLMYGAIYTHLETYIATRLFNTLITEYIWFVKIVVPD